MTSLERSAGPPRTRRLVASLAGVVASVLVVGCSAYTARHEIQWDSRVQIWKAEPSQVKVRSAQSRIFDTSDKLRTIQAVVATLQDLDFQIELLDEELGVVSGKKFAGLEKPGRVFDPFYYLYDEESLLVFTKTYRTWGPFWHRSNLVRLTVTVRKRNERQLIVRAAAQFYLRPIEDPEPYQAFFRTLEQTLFLERQLSPDRSVIPPEPASAPAWG